MPLYDKDGKEVEGAMTKEEVEKAVSDAEQALIDDAAKDVEAQATKDKEAADKKAIDDKAAADKKVADDAVAAAGGKKDEPVLDPRVETISQRLDRIEREKLADIHAGTDPTRRAEFLSKYGRLTGYADTPEGVAERSADAVKMAFGETPSVDVSADAASGRNVDTKAAVKITEADKVIGAALGITDADREKFTPKTS